MKNFASLFNTFKNYSGELFIIFLLIFTVNNFTGGVKQTINADGIGYYDYLPAAFIYKDFPLKGKVVDSSAMDRQTKTGVYVNYNESKLNKYPCGTALLLLPFFTYAHFTAPVRGYDNNGFTLPYQKAVYYAAIFYLFLGLIFIRKILLLYDISALNIFFIQLLIVLATSILHYTYFDPAFSHIYSFFAICGFIYFSKAFFLSKDSKHFLVVVLFLGLVIILRQINILIIFFLPFLAGSFTNLKFGIYNVFEKKKILVKSFLLFFIIIFIQLALWYLQTGKFVVDSYQGEGFNFLNPEFFKILFSYQKGLFIYTPVVFLSLVGLFYLIKEKSYYLFFTWTFFFILLTYILSSWWSWYYGASYGLRAYIDYYPVFAILLGIALSKLTRVLKVAFIFLCLLTVPLNVIQTWQYKVYMLHWWEMDKDKYWKIFLKKKDVYKGMVWKRRIAFKNEYATLLKEKEFSNILIPPKEEEEIYTELINDSSLQNLNVIQLVFENNFNSNDNSIIELYIKNTARNEIYYSHNIPLLHFSEKKLNSYNTGFYDFELTPVQDAKNLLVVIVVHPGDNHVELKNVKIRYYKV